MKYDHHEIQPTHFWVYICRKKNSVSPRDICTPMFVAALFPTVKIQKYPKGTEVDISLNTRTQQSDHFAYEVRTLNLENRPGSSIPPGGWPVIQVL